MLLFPLLVLPKVPLSPPLAARKGFIVREQIRFIQQVVRLAALMRVVALTFFSEYERNFAHSSFKCDIYNGEYSTLVWKFKRRLEKQLAHSSIRNLHGHPS
jgi:hypothetical protein